MAFLCPARRKKSKVKIKGPRPLDAPIPGRITGSDSIDTLVRVGLEKEAGPRAKMVVLHDFHPCVDDELAVKRGQEVYVLYQENDWLYVIADNTSEGFVPYTYCLPVQRCVDDFVTQSYNNNSQSKSDQPNKPKHPNYENVDPKFVKNNNSHNTSKLDTSKKQKQTKSKSKSSNNSGKSSGTKPSYQFAPIVKEGHTLKRRSSKSLPDISDLSVDSPTRYPVSGHAIPDKSNKVKIEDEEDHTYGMSLKRQSRSIQRQSRDQTMNTQQPRGSHSQPASPTRVPQYHNYGITSTDYPTNQRSSSTPGTPTATHHPYALSATGSKVKPYRHSAGSDIVVSNQNTRGLSSDQILLNQLKNSYFNSNSSSGSARNLSSSYSVANNSYRNAADFSSNLSSSYPNTSSAHNQRQRSNSGSSHQPSNHSSSHANQAYQHSYQHHSPGSISSAHNMVNGTGSPGHNSTIPSDQVQSFTKTSQGQCIVLYTFTAAQENDITVEKGETVTVLNTEDEDWLWVRRSDNHEGFVPSNYVMKTNVGNTDTDHSYDSLTTNQAVGSVNSTIPASHQPYQRQHSTNYTTQYNNYNSKMNQHPRQIHGHDSMGIIPKQTTSTKPASSGSNENSPIRIHSERNNRQGYMSDPQTQTRNVHASRYSGSRNPTNYLNQSGKSLSNAGYSKQFNGYASQASNQYDYSNTVNNMVLSNINNSEHQYKSSLQNAGQNESDMKYRGTTQDKIYYNNTQNKTDFGNTKSYSDGSRNVQRSAQIEDRNKPLSSQLDSQNEYNAQLEKQSKILMQKQSENLLSETMGLQRIVCLYSYEAQAPDDITVTRGDFVYANMSQADPDWLWIYHPAVHKSGYVPRTYIKTPKVRS